MLHFLHCRLTPVHSFTSRLGRGEDKVPQGRQCVWLAQRDKSVNILIIYIKKISFTSVLGLRPPLATLGRKSKQNHLQQIKRSRRLI